MSEYYAGMGCKCAAWSENECACPDVDWTPEEVYELSKQLKALQAATKTVLEKHTYIGNGLAAVEASELDVLFELLDDQEASDGTTKRAARCR